LEQQRHDHDRQHHQRGTHLVVPDRRNRARTQDQGTKSYAKNHGCTDRLTRPVPSFFRMDQRRVADQRA